LYSFVTETNTRYHRCLTSGPPAPRWPNIGPAAHHTSSGRQCHGPAAAASRIYNLGHKKWGEGGIRTQAAETRLQHLTTALRSLWWFGKEINIYNSLFHIPSDGSSGPRGTTGLVELLHWDHVAHAEHVFPVVFLFNLRLKFETSVSRS
jgi:hypothetical protein